MQQHITPWLSEIVAQCYRLFLCLFKPGNSDLKTAIIDDGDTVTTNGQGVRHCLWWNQVVQSIEWLGLKHMRARLLSQLTLSGLSSYICKPHCCPCVLWSPSLLLQVLEACVKNCGHRFHILVSSREFVEGVLVRAIIPKNNPPLVLHDRVLSIIQVGSRSMLWV